MFVGDFSVVPLMVSLKLKPTFFGCYSVNKKEKNVFFCKKKRLNIFTNLVAFWLY